MKRFSLIWNICFTLALVAFTGYALGDTFLFSRVYQVVAAEEEKDDDGYVEETDSTVESESVNATVSEDEYSDEHITVKISTLREYDTTIHVADITVDSAEYLKTYLANNSYGRNVTQTTSEMADATNAIIAINGDYYGTQESGYVIRNGVIYRDSAKSNQEDLVIYEDGSSEIINEDDVTAQELLDKGAVNVLSFGPALVTVGSVSVDENDEVGRSMASNPRTAIGMIEEGHYVMVVSDGRTSDDEGLSLYQLAEVMEELGVQTAYNLDGGGSSTMVFNGEVINNPTGGHMGHGSSGSGNSASERAVSDMIYIGY